MSNVVAAVSGSNDTDTSQNDNCGDEVFQVIVRFRPLNDREIRALHDDENNNNDDDDAANDTNELLQIYSDTTFSFDEKIYSFDRVFDETVDQLQLYESVVLPLAKRFIQQPHDITVIAYGQTSSGKTHTIDGDNGNSNDNNDKSSQHNSLSPRTGILPRLIHDVFQLASDDFRLEFSFYEIYCEKIVDLLAEKQVEIQLYDDRSCGKVFMKNLTWEKCENAAQLLQRLNTTRTKRHYAFTEMNSNSSRSHTIFDLRLIPTTKSRARKNHKRSTVQSDGQQNPVEFKNCRIVDLAGSERAARTKAIGLTFEEGKKINQSLMDLRSIISQLSRGSSTNNAVVNHRASKLTRILYGSFRGKSRVIVLVCCSPAMDSRSETNCSLRFACHAKKISLKLDEIKVTTNSTTNNPSSTLYEEAVQARIALANRVELMINEAQLREQKIAEYETEMNELRVLSKHLQQGNLKIQHQFQQQQREQMSIHQRQIEQLEWQAQSLRERMLTEQTLTKHKEDDASVQTEPVNVPPAALSRPIDDTHFATERYLVLLEKERRRNERYRKNITELRHALDEQIHDNKQLEHRLQTMRILKNMLLKEL